MNKRCSISLCDIRLNVLNGGTVLDTSPMGPSKKSEIIEKIKKDLPIDQIHITLKRKREDTDSETEGTERNSEENKIYEKPKKKIVKVISESKEKENKENKESSEEEVMSDDDHSSESDTSYEITRVMKTRNKSNKKSIHKSKASEKCSYEKMIERNRAESLAFLKSLKIEELKSEIADAAKAINERRSSSGSIKKHHQKKDVSVLPPRRSRRLAKLNADFSEDSLFENAIRNAMIQSQMQSKKPISPKLTFAEALSSEDLYKTYVKYVNIQESKASSKIFSYSRSFVQNLTLKDSNIAKVVPGRITTLTWYPSADHLILAAGSKYGDVGIWNVESESRPYVFTIHSEGSTNLQFSPYDPVKLFSSSYDGTLRCGDLVKHTFNEVYNVSDKTSSTYFDFVSSSTFVVALRNGHVALLDRRDAKSCEKIHPCHDNSIKTVNVHPVDKNFFVTAENRGSVRVWDLRKLQRIPVAYTNYHQRCVNSAFFSSASGNSILTTSFDDSICIFDSKKLTQDLRLTKRMKHNNNTGRWLSIFRAVWLPNTNDAFVVGSMQDSPRRIEIIDKDLNVYHTLMHENLTTITSVNIFHPFRPSLAGSNSSGKVFVFTPRIHK